MTIKKFIVHQSRHWVNALLFLCITLISLLAWYVFVLAPMLNQLTASAADSFTAKNKSRVSLEGKAFVQANKAWLKNPYQQPAIFRKFLLDTMNKFRVVASYKFIDQQHAVELTYQGAPQTVLLMSWYHSFPALYMRFSHVELRCEQSNNCKIQIVARVTDNKIKQVVGDSIFDPLKNYFDFTKNQQVMLPYVSIFQIHQLDYVHHANKTVSLIGAGQDSAVVNVGDLVGVEHAEIISISARRVVARYNEFGKQQILSFS